ncbi:MAG: alanine--tRNA ligase [bacterium]
MTSSEIRQKFLDFYKKRGHQIVPSSSLIPENDPTTLFTGSGMQPIVPYLLGEKHPSGFRLADSQKCFRSEDIEEVGDNRHNTFFEMLGNWSLGDYFKKEQLTWLFEFLTQELKLDPKRLYATVFRGNKEINIDKDSESVDIWKELFFKEGITAKDVDFAEKDGMQDGRIFYYDETKNWWSRSGVSSNMPIGEPGGPDSEVFYDLGANLKLHEESIFKNKECHLNCDCGRFVEIGNSVFMEYLKTENGFEELKQKNVDFGGGLERMTMVAQNKDNFFDTDLFSNSIKKIQELSGKEDKSEDTTKAIRIIAEHLRAVVFIMGDNKGIVPSNTDQGYIVRRLIRRAIRYGKQIDINKELWTKQIAEVVINDYKEAYPELNTNREFVIKQLDDEEAKFSKTLEKGLRQFDKLGKDGISGTEAFNLYQTFGFPIEMTKELAQEKGIKIDEKEFQKELEKHQDISRSATAGKFKSGLADTGEKTIKLHTAAHLLLAALRKVLGNNVFQKGSNITPERLRFDFSYSEKLTDEQKQKTEDLVNEIIKKDIPVVCEEMPLDEAKKQNAMGVFESKYGEKVKVYTLGDFSKEICAGPHVKKTGDLGHFKIIKEQSSSAGIRRIKAVLE